MSFCVECVENAELTHDGCLCLSPWSGGDCSEWEGPCPYLCSECSGPDSCDACFPNASVSAVDGHCQCDSNWIGEACDEWWEGYCDEKCEVCDMSFCVECVANAELTNFGCQCLTPWSGDDCKEWVGPCPYLCDECSDHESCDKCSENAVNSGEGCVCAMDWVGDYCDQYVGICYDACSICLNPEDCAECALNAYIDSATGSCVCDREWGGPQCVTYIGNCDARCDGCWGPSNMECNGCAQDTYDSGLGTCECITSWNGVACIEVICDDPNCYVCDHGVCEVCNAGYHLKRGNECEPCHPECAECTGPESSDCTSCASGFVLANETCMACAPQCAECFGPDPLECVTCTADSHAVTEGRETKCVCNEPLVRNPVDLQCVAKCPLGMLADSHRECISLGNSGRTEFVFSTSTPIYPQQSAQHIALDSCSPSWPVDDRRGHYFDGSTYLTTQDDVQYLSQTVTQAVFVKLFEENQKHTVFSLGSFSIGVKCNEIIVSNAPTQIKLETETWYDIIFQLTLLDVDENHALLTIYLNSEIPVLETDMQTGDIWTNNPNRFTYGAETNGLHNLVGFIYGASIYALEASSINFSSSSNLSDCPLAAFENIHHECEYCDFSCYSFGCEDKTPCGECPSHTRACVAGDCGCGAIFDEGRASLHGHDVGVCVCEIAETDDGNCLIATDDIYCIENNEFGCKKCAYTYKLDAGICVPCDGQCPDEPEEICQCDDGYSLHENSCSICVNNCSQCEDDVYEYCTTCKEGYVESPDLHVCLSECPTGYIASEGKCVGEVSDSANSLEKSMRDLIEFKFVDEGTGYIYGTDWSYTASRSVMINNMSHQYEVTAEAHGTIVSDPDRGMFLDGWSSASYLEIKDLYFGSSFSAAIWMEA